MTGHRDIPADNGQTPSVDDEGQVHGSGLGAGGGQNGEDMSSDAAAGYGYPVTGSEVESPEDRELDPPVDGLNPGAVEVPDQVDETPID